MSDDASLLPSASFSISSKDPSHETDRQKLKNELYMEETPSSLSVSDFDEDYILNMENKDHSPKDITFECASILRDISEDANPGQPNINLRQGDWPNGRSPSPLVSIQIKGSSHEVISMISKASLNEGRF